MKNWMFYYWFGFNWSFLDNSQTATFIELLNAKRTICDWRSYDKDEKKVKEIVNDDIKANRKSSLVAWYICVLNRLLREMNSTIEKISHLISHNINELNIDYWGDWIKRYKSLKLCII
jgi:hypothetical protein